MFLTLLLLYLAVSEGVEEEMCYDADIIIIGGGISGIAALSNLLKNGYDRVRVLEGRSEIGGRIRKFELGDTVVELGANWIHGVDKNPITRLVKMASIQGQAEKPSSIVCRDNRGSNRTLEFLQEQNKLKMIFQKLQVKSSNFSWINEQWYRKGYRYKSLRDVLKEEGWHNDTELRNAAEISLIDFQDAVSPDFISSRATFKSSGNINSATGVQYFITDQRGYISILDELFEASTNFENHVEVNKTVEGVYWNRHGVRVITTDGASITSKIALVTVSVGVLKKKIRFEPSLPKWKLDAIKVFQMAIYTKIFLKFPTMFWDNVEYIYYMSPKRGYYPVWQSLDAEGRMPFKTNVLIVTVTDSESERIESMRETDVIKEVMSVLREVYGHDIPEPSHFVIPKWGKDPYFYGSYTYTSPYQTHEAFLKMQANVGPIFFSGEAMHETYAGYLHGSLCHAETVSYDIISFLKTRTYFPELPNLSHYQKCFRDSCGGCFIH